MNLVDQSAAVKAQPLVARQLVRELLDLGGLEDEVALLFCDLLYERAGQSRSCDSVRLFRSSTFTMDAHGAAATAPAFPIRICRSIAGA